MYWKKGEVNQFYCHRTLLNCSEENCPWNQDEEIMSLPNGTTCSDCRSFKRCSMVVGAKSDWKSCDFYPSRFREEMLT